MASGRRTRAAVSDTGSVADARLAAGAGGPGSADPLVAELRRAGLLRLLVLHEAGREPTYGNRLMERIAELTAGAVTVNPNTIYPLLRALEERGLLNGRWEHPERRSRRFYALTAAGVAERDRLASELAPRLDAVAAAVERLRAEVLGA